MTWIRMIIPVLLLSGCGQLQEIANIHATGNVIVCFGDSLTEGYGAQENESYPQRLKEMSGLNVINSGISGDTSQDALVRLEKDVIKYHPRMVIMTLGANDFFRQLPKRITVSNMTQIIDRIQAGGAMVVWAEAKTGLITDAYLKDFRDLAKRKKILLIEDIMKGIMFNLEYKSDQIHPNAKGYDLIAKRIWKEIKPYLQ